MCMTAWSTLVAPIYLTKLVGLQRAHLQLWNPQPIHHSGSTSTSIGLRWDCTVHWTAAVSVSRVASRRLVLPDNCALCGCHDTLTRRIYDTRLSPGPRSPCPSHLVSVLDTVVVVVLQMALRGPHHFLTQSLYSFT